MFKEHGPLSLEEIEELLEEMPPNNEMVTEQHVANKLGVSTTRVQSKLKEHGIEPDMVARRIRFYRVDRLGPVVQAFTHA